jgi:hypothetical protein
MADKINEIDKVYFGDAVYAHYDGFHIVLTTEDGMSVTNQICLDPDVSKAVTLYINKHTIEGGG